MQYVLADTDNCTYHSLKPQFVYGSNTGTYPWCNTEAVRFSTGVHTGGCEKKPHSFKILKPDSLSYKFLTKYYELINENNKHQINSRKPEKLENEEEKDDLQLEDSKSTPPVIKHKLMSLLWLVKEFTKTKRSKGRNINCSECIKLNSWWNEWLMMEDEDDDTPDFNFVLPKKLKPSSIK